MSQSQDKIESNNDYECQTECCESKLELMARTNSESKDKSAPKRDNKYYAQKMKESRHRRKKLDKLFYKKFVYTVDIGGKKYVFLSKSDMNITRLHKDMLKLNDQYILTY